MDYTEADLPVRIHHGEIVTLAGGKSVRFDSNGEAKDIFFGDEFNASLQLFPGMEHEFEAGGVRYRLVPDFDDTMLVEKL
ncbi:hypothetical protein [Desulfovibrio aminophilus]|uniref:hypothetical protein n=1 Tax=Desulfovibrio aminophilus TaxID=81425 RepID=UPI00339490DF